MISVCLEVYENLVRRITPRTDCNHFLRLEEVHVIIAMTLLVAFFEDFLVRGVVWNTVPLKTPSFWKNPSLWKKRRASWYYFIQIEWNRIQSLLQFSLRKHGALSTPKPTWFGWRNGARSYPRQTLRNLLNLWEPGIQYYIGGNVLLFPCCKKFAHHSCQREWERNSHSGFKITCSLYAMSYRRSGGPNDRHAESILI